MDRQVGLRSAEDVRRAAEAHFSSRPTAPAPRSKEEAEALLHELGVHQVELEMQNDELRRTQMELESSWDRYAVLYDRAPVGYLTLDREGKIVECNLATAALLGLDQDRLRGLKLSSFVSWHEADAFYLHLFSALRD